MATRIESPQTSSLATARPHESMGARIVPISNSAPPVITMSAPNDASSAEPMDITSPSTGHGHGSDDTNGKGADRSKNSSPPDHASSNMPAPPPAAAAAIHQPKIVQTAFIHKLYNMLEDPNIQHLISWSSSAESFIMSPSNDFSKVLSQYFKHTNISSFVRQLNMYGFHKERDVFHTGSPDTTLWEFKHGNGNFKRGDIAGLREIKRRASRHALVHRETNYPKPTSQPGTPAEPIQLPPESSDARLANIEHTLYDMSARLQRSEDNAHFAHLKSQAMTETLGRMLSLNQDLSRAMLSVIPSDSQVYRDVLAMQGEVQRQAEMLRTFDEPHEPPYGNRQQYFGNLDNAPVSPRQLAQDDARRSTLAVPPGRAQHPYRPSIPSNLSISTRRSIGGSSTTQSSPLRNAPAPPPPGPHPLSNVEMPPSMARRHTSADIRDHGWPAGPSPFSASNTPTSGWPSSPSHAVPEDQRIRESLSSFTLQTASQAPSHSRPTTPPPPFASNMGNGTDTFGSWSWNSASNRDGRPLALKDSSAPPTRRGSMAHILNPSDTAERSDEDEDPRGDDDRKRKRRQ